MRAGERAELEEMRERIVTRINELQDDVDAGTISDEERYKKLEEEFGPHYHQTLNEINALLHGQQPRSHHLDKRLPGFVGAALVLVLAASLLFSTGLTGAVVAEERTTKLDLALADGQAAPLPLPARITVTGAEYTTAQASAHRLVLEDATGRHELISDGRCTGCNETYRAPYRLSAHTDGVVHVTSISYEVTQ